jgi:AAA+ ATPase superfamily predicted ATPase
MYTEQLVPSYGELFELNKDAFTKFGIPNLKHLIEESTKWSTKNVEKARLYNSDEGKHGAKLLPFFNQMQVVEHFMDRVQKLTDNPSQIKDRGLSQVKDWDMFINGWLPYQGTMDKLPTEFAGSLSEFF